MRLRLSAAAAAATLILAGPAPAQTFYRYATSPAGVEAGVVFAGGGFKAATRANGAVTLMQDADGLATQSVYVISDNGRYVGGTAAGWGWVGNTYSYFTYPVVWDAQTQRPRVIDQLPPRTRYAVPVRVNDDGSGEARVQTWAGVLTAPWGPAAAAAAQLPAAPTPPPASPPAGDCVGGRCGVTAPASHPARRTGPVRRLLGW